MNEKVLTKIAQAFAAKFAQQLPKRKLGQFVPIAGMAVGAGLSYMLIDRIAISARDAYRERFLLEKADDFLSATPDFGGADLAQDDDVIGVIELLREEDALPSPPQPGPEDQLDG